MAFGDTDGQKWPFLWLLQLTVIMESIVVENIYLLVIVTLVSVLQNGETEDTFPYE